jgi:hypothetical protein
MNEKAGGDLGFLCFWCRIVRLLNNPNLVLGMEIKPKCRFFAYFSTFAPICADFKALY